MRKNQVYEKTIINGEEVMILVEETEVDDIQENEQNVNDMQLKINELQNKLLEIQAQLSQLNNNS
mgnify:FL=1